MQEKYGSLEADLDRFRFNQQLANDIKAAIEEKRDNIYYAIEKSNLLLIQGDQSSHFTKCLVMCIFETRYSTNEKMAIIKGNKTKIKALSKAIDTECSAFGHSLVGHKTLVEDTVEITKNRIVFYSTECFLGEMMDMDIVNEYSIIIIEDFDFQCSELGILLRLLKGIQIKNPLLKVILLVDSVEYVAGFSELDMFFGCGVLNLSINYKDIDTLYLSIPTKDYLEEALSTVMKIGNEDGDVLIFLPERSDVETLAFKLENIPSRYKNEIYQLCTGSQHEELQKVYRESKYKTRKIILCSTALLEKIEGVRHVIDTGLQKTRKYHYETDTEVVEVGFISKKIADHRSSFARQKEYTGKCYRLYTTQLLDNESNHFSTEDRVGVFKSVLAAIAITKSLVDCISISNKELMAFVYQNLYEMGLISLDPLSPTQLDLYPILVTLPLDPILNNLIVLAYNQPSSELEFVGSEIITICSMLFVARNNELFLDNFSDSRNKFLALEGDHITFLNIYDAYYNAYSKNSSNIELWCSKNNLSYSSLHMVHVLRYKIARIVSALYPLSKTNIQHGNISKTVVIRKLLIRTFCNNIAELLSDGSYKNINSSRVCHIHPSSALFKFAPKYVLYSQAIQTTKPFIRFVSEIDPDWLVQTLPTKFKL